MKTSTPMLVMTSLLVTLFGMQPPAVRAESLAEGTAAPNFSLPDQNGKIHDLASYRGRWVVLAFYPADMTPGCTLENRSLRDAEPDLEKLGVQVFAISVQDSASHAKFCQQEGLTQTLLADTGKQTARDYGVLGDRGVANRVTFIVNPQGKIAKRIDKVSVQTHGQDLVAQLKELKADPPADPPQYSARTRGIKTLKSGDKAPLFNLPEIGGGGVVALSDLRTGKHAVVVIWVGSQCPVSQAYKGRMHSLAEAEQGKGIAFVGIDSNAGESQPAMEEQFGKRKLGFPVLRDINNTVADEYGAIVTPEAFLVDAEGVIRYHGAIDDAMDPAEVRDNYLRDAIAAFLAQGPIKPADTKAFGCSVKRIRKK